MKFNIDIKELYQEFKNKYEVLYNENGGVPTLSEAIKIPKLSEAIKAFDNFLNDEENNDFINKFVNYIGDPILSYLEGVAIMFALEELVDDFNLYEYIDKKPR